MELEEEWADIITEKVATPINVTLHILDLPVEAEQEVA